MYYMTFSNTVFTSNKLMTKMNLLSCFIFALYLRIFENEGRKDGTSQARK